MNGAFDGLSVITRALNPTVVLVWAGLSAVSVLTPERKANSGYALRRRRVIEPMMIAFFCIMMIGFWHQIGGPFIPFSTAWPSAIIMGCTFSLLFVIIVNLQERVSIAHSAFMLALFSLPGSVFFALAYFALPPLIRWEMRLLGL